MSRTEFNLKIREIGDKRVRSASELARKIKNPTFREKGRAKQSSAMFRDKRGLLDRPIVHQIGDHVRVSQGRGIAELIDLISGDLAQDAPHDLARASLR